MENPELEVLKATISELGRRVSCLEREQDHQREVMAAAGEKSREVIEAVKHGNVKRVFELVGQL